MIELNYVEAAPWRRGGVSAQTTGPRVASDKVLAISGMRNRGAKGPTGAGG